MIETTAKVRPHLSVTLGLCLMVILAELSLFAADGLSFQQSRIETKVAADAKTVTVPYLFKNDSDRTITIKRYDSACSCLSAKVKGGKLSYKPGEQRENKVVFDLGNFPGLVAKNNLIWTTNDDDNKPSSILSVVIDIPMLFELHPKTTFWDQNGGSEPKTIKLRVNSPEPIRILEHSVTNKSFSYELRTLKEGFEYVLVVEPKDVSTPAFGMIKLTTDSANPRYRRQMAFVCVRRQNKVPSVKP